jgi:hypothetical protein
MPLLLLVVCAFMFGLAFWIGLGLTGWWWVRRLGVEIEWNPLSAASRAARAERRGRYGAALHWYARAGQGEHLLASRFRYGLPNWPVRSLLIEIGCELVRLERGTLVARAAGVPPAMTQAIAAEAERTAEAFWRSAERIGAAAQQLEVLRYHPDLGREMEHLADLLQTIRDLRHTLAALTLTGLSGSDERDEARYVLLRLQALAALARDLTEHHHAASA